MHQSLSRIILCLALVLTAGPSLAEVFYYAKDSHRMNAAVADARETLPRVMSKVFTGNRAPSNLHFKVAIPTGLNSPQFEIISVGEVRRRGAGYAGVYLNQPRDIPGNKGGSVRFVEDQISDWTLIVDDKMFGGYTTRVMLRHMSPDQARMFRRTLTRNPLPKGF